MAKDHQGLIRRQVIDARWDLRHRNMQGAFELADIKLSRLSHIENDVLPSCGPHIRKLLNRDVAALYKIEIGGFPSLQVLAYNMKRMINIFGVNPLMQAIAA